MVADRSHTRELCCFSGPCRSIRDDEGLAGSIASSQWRIDVDRLRLVPYVAATPHSIVQSELSVRFAVPYSVPELAEGTRTGNPGCSRLKLERWLQYTSSRSRADSVWC